MAEDAQQTPHAAPAESHVAAKLNPEQHLQDSHKLSIQVQGKMGPTGEAVWALVKEERGKTKTLKVHRGTRRAAAAVFFDYVHPNKEMIAGPAPRRGPIGMRPRSPRPPQRGGGGGGAPRRPAGPRPRP